MECRICLDDSNPEDLISPCRCNAVVHETCLQRWRAECIDNPDKYDRCEICTADYVIIAKKPKENFFILQNTPPKALSWGFLFFIWFVSILTGTIDTMSNYNSIRILGIRHNGTIRYHLRKDVWANISYYQSMSVFFFTIFTQLLIKSLSLCCVYQKCKYNKLMCISDFNYFLSSLPYPFFLITAHDLGTSGLFLTMGAATILITIPMTVDYIKRHNKALTDINRKYNPEKIMNVTYNPLPNDIFEVTSESDENLDRV